ncbi:hypothetical protein [Agreia sp. COWG]|uniref:hypothetical protein n=1 Tax=Agreia sp. COWG TaxID=2773266 RepID=UPI0019269AB6|nr:hypothetical protein [Agreia sp. COWG]CAD6009486.1 Putative protein, involved in import and assembly of intermembrane space proteins [Agreia sp. COWG]
MSDEIPTEGEKLGTDGTIPNSPDGIALGHGGDSHFNPEEDAVANDPGSADDSDSAEDDASE